MKRSYQLIILATIILFGTTAMYDLAIWREFKTGGYKKPESNYDKLNFRDFDTIEIVASNVISATIKQGNRFDVKRHKWMDNIRVEQKGTVLVITFKAKSSMYAGSSSNDILIECPTLKQIKTDAVFLLDGKQIKSRKNHHKAFYSGYVYVRGFKQDSIELVMNNFSSIYFRDNKFNFLHADVGSQDSSRSTIDIDKSNEILFANINLQHSSIMNLDDIHIKNFKYKLSDSAQVKLSGISLRLLSNKK